MSKRFSNFASRKQSTTMKRISIILIFFLSIALEASAVLKEKDLDQTLSILRTELTKYNFELSSQQEQRKSRQKDVFIQMMSTMKRANQNALMLYSQKQDYVFDLTYACHEATEQYQQFQSQQLPFRTFIEQNDREVSRYDSLITSLATMPVNVLSDQGRIDRNVCLTLATSIRSQLTEDSEQTIDYIRYYENTEKHLKHLNDYAQLRYADIQTSIFKNGSRQYLEVLRHFRTSWNEALQVARKKYNFNNEQSQWSSIWIFGTFAGIIVYVVIAIILNLLFFRFIMPQRLKTEEFKLKRTCTIMASTTVTFAVIQGLVISNSDQNFLIMASNLLVEYAWLVGVILISLLLRVDGHQINSAFRIYSPLAVVGFIVIAFRIILIPGELVNLVFPPILLLCMLWQASVIHRHSYRVPRSDKFFSIVSQVVFIAAGVCSWVGYTLLAVQLLIWWIMQLTCILTITCVSQYIELYATRHGMANKPITNTWGYLFVERVVMPTLSVLSIMLSIFWAANVFNLSDLCWGAFNHNFINLPNLQVSIIKLATVVCLWFLFRYIVNTTLALMRMHYEKQDPTTAASREVMGKNVIQVLIWGIWLLMSLSILNISVAWLLAISGGLSTGIGFASKDIIENIYYGASLMAGRIKVGDWIEVDGTIGKVSSISYTSTIIESLSGEIITFQNSQLFAKNYKNLTRNHGYVLAIVPFGVAYGSNLKRVQTLVEEAVGKLSSPWIDHKKPIKTVVSEMADSSVNLKLFIWADAVKKAYVISDTLTCIYDTLNNNGIEIPFPQQDVYIKS